MFYVLLHRAGWVAGSSEGINIIFSHEMKNRCLELFIHGFHGGTVGDTAGKKGVKGKERIS